MPLLLVYGVPDGVDGLPALTAILCSSVMQFPDFELTPDQVSVFYPVDRMQEGLGEELILIVDGFFKKPKRTPPMMDEWAKALCDHLRAFAQENIPYCKKVEVIMRVFDPHFNAFASWEKPQ